MIWLLSSGSSSATEKLARPCRPWKNATERHLKLRPATLSVGHLPDISAKISTSGSSLGCLASSETGMMDGGGSANDGTAEKIAAIAKARRQRRIVMLGGKAMKERNIRSGKSSPPGTIGDAADTCHRFPAMSPLR